MKLQFTRIVLWLLVSFFPCCQLVFCQQVDSNAFVGARVCAECHQSEHKQWKGSHHDLAMQEVSDATVLGDFNDAVFKHQGVQTSFFKKKGNFYVKTEGPEGNMVSYEVAYVFGVYPLQQYLLKFPRGYYQAFSVAWDSRVKSQGGQRWFHLHPDEQINVDDVLHWTHRSYNWNYMCAECHSTNLLKNYDEANDSYTTSWSEIDVSCEACHGPGEQHVASAKSGEKQTSKLFLSASSGGAWSFEEGVTTAVKKTPIERTEVEACARCHSRRSLITEPYEYGEPLLDTHRLSLLTEDLYYPDGQIKDEVFVYGSFLQSKMYHAGVTCSDCHNAHTLKLKASGNQLCSQCHKATVFDTQKHHFHKTGTSGSQCVDCHMPSKLYMVVDDRHDHSFRVPRPDLSEKLAAPNACNACHADKSPAWAAQEIKKHTKDKSLPRHYGEPLSSARNRAAGASNDLLALFHDQQAPDIVRATAVAQLQAYIAPSVIPLVELAAKDEGALLRMAAADFIDNLPPQIAVPIGLPLLEDSVKAVRLAATGSLAKYVRDTSHPEFSKKLAKALQEYEQTQLLNADHPSGQLNLGLLETMKGNYQQAEKRYLKAIEQEPGAVRAYVNLADLYRGMQRDKQAEATLRSALEKVPENPELMHTLGLNLVRLGKSKEAMNFLSSAASQQPENARFQYVYAIALNSEGKKVESLAHIEKSLEKLGDDMSLLTLAASLSQELGDLKKALFFAERIVAQDPSNVRWQQFVSAAREALGSIPR